jgi:hypothetical protein
MNSQMPNFGGSGSGDPLRSCPVDSVLQGAWRFAIVSIVGFGVWAFAGRWFRTHGGEAGLYAASTVVFVGLAGLLMHPLVRGPSLVRVFTGSHIQVKQRNSEAAVPPSKPSFGVSYAKQRNGAPWR